MLCVKNPTLNKTKEKKIVEINFWEFSEKTRNPRK